MIWKPWILLAFPQRSEIIIFYDHFVRCNPVELRVKHALAAPRLWVRFPEKATTDKCVPSLDKSVRQMRKCTPCAKQWSQHDGQTCRAVLVGEYSLKHLKSTSEIHFWVTRALQTYLPKVFPTRDTRKTMMYPAMSTHSYCLGCKYSLQMYLRSSSSSSTWECE